MSLYIPFRIRQYCDIVGCQLSCNSCPREPLVLSPEEARLMEAVAKYGVAQGVEVSEEILTDAVSDVRVIRQSCV